ncbi:MAG TPA: iron-regulated protein [Bacteroidales bacterium]|nr:iron-regulated protein [Bacteroidales bacterium]
MKNSFVLLFLASLVSFAFKTDKPAYALFDKNGDEVKYSKMVDRLTEADIVFFGELHDNPIAHWLQLELTKDLFAEKKGKLILGAEMFEADNQLILSEYISGLYKSEKFEADARLWTNYKTDYKPLVEFALKSKIPFIATNVPRRYAALVNDKGFEGLRKLSSEALKYVSPNLVQLYDSTVACYSAMLKMGEGHATPNIPKAQATKDATMAYFILKNSERDKLFLHYNGSYHSDNFEGIVWWIKKLHPELKVMTISTVSQDTIKSLTKEYINRADYIVVVPEDMTKTNKK